MVYDKLIYVSPEDHDYFKSLDEAIENLDSDATVLVYELKEVGKIQPAFVPKKASK